MNRLLNVNFIRLWKNKIIWIEMAVMFLWAAILLISGYYDTIKVPELHYSLDDYMFRYAPYIGGFCAIFTSMFLGTDYSDGTIRNKLVVGHSRQSLYLSNAIVCAAAGIMVHAVWILAMLTIGVPLFGWFEGGILTLLAYLLVSVLMIAALISIFTLISMLTQGKATSVVITMLTFLLLVILASYCFNKLEEPEMNSGGYMVTTNGSDTEIIKQEGPTPNPYYVSGYKREIFDFIVHFLPTGQGISISVGKTAGLLLMPLYSLILIVLTTVSGILIFRRKDLK